MNYNYIVKKVSRQIDIATKTRQDKVNLSKMSIVDLSEHIDRLIPFSEIDLSNNLIQNIPSQIAKLKNLRILNLFNNKIFKISNEIGKLQN